ncbi:MAG TPA: alpha/beta fold hydrolase [Gaiellales bacterium]|nr:alpha/beta fold hydrolase [Gaiellales bacterium]
MDLHYQIAGEGSPVVLIHAGIADSRMWDPQWEAFTARHRTLRYDMREFGESAAPQGPFAHGRDLIGLLEQLGLGPAALVGASLGGRVAAEVAVARPDLVRGLVLVGPGLPSTGWSDEVRAYGEEEERLLEAGDVEGAAEVTVRFWVDGVGRQPGDVDPAVRDAVRAMQLRAYEHIKDADPDAERLTVEDVASRVGEISVPTLLIVGDHDRADIVRTVEWLAKEIPEARLVWMPGTAHVPNMERPERFTELVLEFLEQT